MQRLESVIKMRHPQPRANDDIVLPVFNFASMLRAVKGLGFEISSHPHPLHGDQDIDQIITGVR